MSRVRVLLAMLVSLSSIGIGGSVGPVRVACIGTEITAGFDLSGGDRDAYPARLQRLLGKGYQVRTFSRPGMTIVRAGDRRGRADGAYRDALRFLPDIVLLELGLHDAGRSGGAGGKSIDSAYTAILSSFAQLASHPRIVALLPTPLFTRDTTILSPTILQQEVIPGIRRSAYIAGCEVANLYNFFLGYAEWFPDGIHPSPQANARIATRLYELLTMPEIPGFDLCANARITGIASNYFGFECRDFSFEGRTAKIVRPRRTAEGNPWVWRARFWGHEPQTETALLEWGFHLVYCDVSELYGNDEAIGIWDRWYEMLVTAGLSTKAVFEEFSRGGLSMYRWAALRPGKIACIYADAPVLDAKSWPGGKGKGHGNPVEWERFKRNFGLLSEEEAIAFRGNPLDLAPRIAAQGFPMLHVCGDADVTVPIAENTDLFEKSILAQGGRITVIRKPGIGHHPHSLANPQPIIDFILSATLGR